MVAHILALASAFSLVDNVMPSKCEVLWSSAGVKCQHLTGETGPGWEGVEKEGCFSEVVKRDGGAPCISGGLPSCSGDCPPPTPEGETGSAFAEVAAQTPPMPAPAGGPPGAEGGR